MTCQSQPLDSKKALIINGNYFKITAMKKCALAICLSLFLGLGLIHLYINLFWSQQDFLNHMSQRMSENSHVNVSVQSMRFSLLKGIEFNNIEVQHTGKLAQTRWFIPSLHTGHKALWRLWQHNTTLSLTVKQTQLKVTSQTTQQSLLAPATSSKLAPLWLQRVQKQLAPLTQHFENFLYTTLSQIYQHWQHIEIDLHNSAVGTDLFFPNSPNYLQNLLQTKWTEVNGQLRWNMHQNHQMHLELSGQRNKHKVAFTLNNTIDNSWHLQSQYEGDAWNLKGDILVEPQMIHIKSIIGSWEQLKFYSRGSINTTHLEADLSNIINLSLDNLPFAWPQSLKALKVKGQMDVFFSIQGPLFEPKKLNLDGSLSSGFLDINGLPVTYASADFRFQDKLLSIHPLKFHLHEQKIQASGSVDLIEPLEPLHVSIKAPKIPLAHLGSLVSLYTQKLPQVPIKANANMDLTIKVPLKSFQDYEIAGSLSAQNVQFKDNATLWRLFEDQSEISLQKLQPNAMQIQFHWNQDRLKVDELKISHKDVVILSRGTLDPHQNILFRLATAQKVEAKTSAKLSKSLNGSQNLTQQQLLQLQGTVNRPTLNQIQSLR